MSSLKVPELDRFLVRTRVSGVYMLVRQGSIDYIGKSVDVLQRVSLLSRSKHGIHFDSVCIIPTSNNDLAERVLVSLIKPPKNIQLKGDLSSQEIEIGVPLLKQIGFSDEWIDRALNMEFVQ